MKQKCGFTLVELLLAAALMVLILTALSGLFVSVTRAYRANEQISEHQQNAEAATQLLKYEIALAGYRGTDPDAATRKLNGASFAVTSGASDTISVRYYEDRPPYSPSSPYLEVVTYSVGKDSNNVWNLYRQQGANKQPAVEGVTKLEVINYRLRDGTQTASKPSDMTTLAGLTVQLTFINGETRTTTISLPSAQCSASQHPCSL